MKSHLKKEKTLLKEISENKDKYFMMLPFSLFFFTFTVISVFSAIALSFTNFNMIQRPEFIGLLNYVRMFLDDEVFPLVIRNTLIFALITGPISYFACLFFAWLINELNPKLRAFLTLVFYIPSISASVFAVWGYIFSGDAAGLVNSTLMRIGIIYEPIQWLTDPRYALNVIIVVQLWASLGTSFLAFIAGLQGVDKAMYESGRVDGIRNRFQELRLITLPSMGPQLLFAAVMQIGAAFAVSQISIELAGFPSTDYAAATIVTHLLDHGIIRFEMGYACAIATVLFITMVSLLKIIRKFLEKYATL